ncbi:TPA: hypothetical protein SCV11_000502 [Campylobacter jejuni]|nr:hypothetical protein [Campylobacter jejuni]
MICDNILVVSGRKDGLGARLSTLFNAWYISQKIGSRFGFIWPKPNNPMSFFKENNKNSDILFDIFSEEELFSKEFCNQYSYTNKIEPFECHLIVEKKIYFKDLLSLNKKIIYAPLCNLREQFIDFDEIDFYNKINKFWSSIKFNEKLEKLILDLKSQIKIMDNFVAMHIRGGEIVYCDNVRRAGNYAYKALPIELAISKIADELKRNNNIILFQDDIKTCEDIKHFFNNQGFQSKVYTFSDFIFKKQLSANERTFLEIILMSKSKMIYSSGSSNFSRVAINIGGISQVSLYKIFNINEQYKILNQYIETIPNIHPLQIAFSYYHLYLIAVKFKNNKSMINYLEKAKKFDPENEFYDILLINSYLLNKNFEEVEKLLEFNFTTRYDNFKKCLLNKFYGVYTSGVVFDNYKNYASSKFPKLSHVVALIYKSENNILLAEKFAYMSLEQSPMIFLYIECFQNKLDIVNKQFTRLKEEHLKRLNTLEKTFEKQPLFGATLRIKNHLAYKLGQVTIKNSKTIKGYIKLPFMLIKEFMQHKKEQKNYQMMIKINPNLVLPKLQEYSDYKEALKIKNYFSYKLGEAIIKANNNWYGGGYIKFIFKDVPRLKSEMKLKERRK